MTLSSHHMFARIVPTKPRHQGHFNTLAIDTGSRWMFMSPGFLAYACSQSIVNTFPKTFLLPFSKIMIDARPFWIFFGQHPPLNAAYYQVQNAINYFTHFQAARASSGFCFWKHFSDNIPL